MIKQLQAVIQSFDYFLIIDCAETKIDINQDKVCFIRITKFKSEGICFPDLMFVLGMLHSKLEKTVLFTPHYLKMIDDLQYLNLKAVLNTTQIHDYISNKLQPKTYLHGCYVHKMIKYIVVNAN